MCYDISYLTKRQVDYAARYGSAEDVEDIQRRLPKVYHINGFQHAEVPVVTNQEPNRLQLFEWGLVPRWVKNREDALTFRQKTLNARGETIFEKPSFRHAARDNRCLVIVDGFFEHYHESGKTFPFFIQRKDGKPLALGGLWEEWHDKEEGVVRFTFSIVTTAANRRMAFLHNNPKILKTGPRMPLILPWEHEKTWLDDTVPPGEIQQLIMPFPEEYLTDYSVPPLRGVHSLGNTPEAVKEHRYAELEGGGQQTLF